MKSIIISSLFMYLLSCEPNHNVKLIWQEIDSATGFVNHGIPVYGKSIIDYHRNDKSVLTVKLEEPVIVSTSKKEEGWGFYQFPTLYQSLDKKLVAKWSMGADAVASYGKDAVGIATSGDGGKTWDPFVGKPPLGGGLLLNSGEQIQIYTPPALKVEELLLPKPIVTYRDSYGSTFAYYRHSEIPEALQGVYIKRFASGGGNFTIEHSQLDDSLSVRYSNTVLFPVVWWGDMHAARDKSIIAGIYPVFYLNEKQEVDPSGIVFYRSTDGAHTWKVQGRIPYQPDLKLDAKNEGKRLTFGYSEPAFEILSDGTFLCVMRTTDGFGISSMYISLSNDQGITWTRPKPFTSNGVLPRLLQLENGVTVLASGRPGVQLRFSIDGKGEKWTDPFEMLPFKNEKETVSCGYTELLRTGFDRFLVIYSDFKYRNERNEIRKAIKVREVIVTPK